MAIVYEELPLAASSRIVLRATPEGALTHCSLGVRREQHEHHAMLKSLTEPLTGAREFLKALIDTNNNRIIGFTMIGPEAGEVMAAVPMAMLAGFPYTVLRDAILTHPTMAEGLNPLFSA